MVVCHMPHIPKLFACAGFHVNNKYGGMIVERLYYSEPTKPVTLSLSCSLNYHAIHVTNLNVFQASLRS
jgi:hypothetical protein